MIKRTDAGNVGESIVAEGFFMSISRSAAQHPVRKKSEKLKDELGDKTTGRHTEQYCKNVARGLEV